MDILSIVRVRKWFAGRMALGIATMAFLISCAPPAMSQARTMTSSGIPLNEIIRVRVKGILFEIPAGFIWTWPQQNARNQINEFPNVAFEFWMPDKRYVETEHISYLGYRPQERGWPSPRADSFVVKVRELVPTDDTADYVSPQQRFANLTAGIRADAISYEKERFGLVRFWRNDWQHREPEPFIYYRHPDGTSPQALLRCTPPHQQPPYPSCVGDIYFASDKMGFFFQMPREELPRWREVAEAARDLVNSWRK